MIGASLAAVLVASSIRYGVAAMSTAGSETASSMPWASVIEPRRAGTSIVASCWVTAARLSVPALTTPSQAAFIEPRARRARKAAKRRPMRRSISRTGLALRRRRRDGRGRDRRRRGDAGSAAGAWPGGAGVAGVGGATVGAGGGGGGGVAVGAGAVVAAVVDVAAVLVVAGVGAAGATGVGVATGAPAPVAPAAGT